MLREKLEGLIAALKDQGFTPVADEREMRNEVGADTSALWYAQAFLRWLLMCPEARDWLAANGLPVEGRVPASCTPLQDAPAPASDKLGEREFFAYVPSFGGLTVVRLDEALGPVLKVVEARPPASRGGVPRRTDITRAQVPEHLRGRLDEVLGKVANHGVHWGNEDGIPEWLGGNDDDSSEGGAGLAPPDPGSETGRGTATAEAEPERDA